MPGATSTGARPPRTSSTARLVLQIRDALALIEDDLDAILRRLAQLAQQFRDTPMAGRSHLQHALPITFGFKCAVWLSALQRHRRRLETLRGEVLVVQFGGAVGTLASLGEDGIAVLAALAEELDLAMPPIAWHVARDDLAEAVCFLGPPDRLARQDRDRHSTPDADRGRRGRRAAQARARRQQHHAAKAQPDRQRVHPRGREERPPAGAGDAGCHAPGPRARDRPLARRVAGAAAGFCADRRRAAPHARPARGPVRRPRPHAAQSRCHPGHDHGRGGDDGAGAGARPRGGASSGRGRLPARRSRPAATCSRC